MRDVEFNYATKENGLMNFRADLPLSAAAKGNAAAADGQMGCIMKIYRDWQLSGDYNFLSKNWKQIKKVLSYAWIEKDGMPIKMALWRDLSIIQWMLITLVLIHKWDFGI